MTNNHNCSGCWRLQTFSGCLEFITLTAFSSLDCVCEWVWGGVGSHENNDLKSFQPYHPQTDASSLLWPAASLDVTVTAPSCLPTEGLTRMMGVPCDKTFPESIENISHRCMQVVGDSFDTFQYEGTRACNPSLPWLRKLLIGALVAVYLSSLYIEGGLGWQCLGFILGTQLLFIPGHFR